MKKLYVSKKRSPIENVLFKKKMKKAEEIIRRYRNTLRALAR
jgi:hypothetical protein